MRSIVLSGIWFSLAASVASSQTTDKSTVVDQLRVYYQKQTTPPWADAIKNLAAADTDRRGTAAAYLVRLLDQAQTDELSGAAPWQATPFWGSSGENPARNLRKEIAGSLAESPGSAATLDVMRWYLDHEKIAGFQERVLPALDKVQGKETDDFCLGLLQPAHENSVVVLAALKQLGKRKAEIPGAVVQSLCGHYRPSIRQAARDLNKERGGPEPAPFDPAKAMQRPEIAALMTSIGALLDQPAPPSAEFVKVTTDQTWEKETRTQETIGWLVKKEGNSWTVLTPFGHRESFHKEETIHGRRGSDVVNKSAWERYPIAQEVARVVAVRTKGDPDFALSERGGLTGQFQGRGAGLYEVMLAHWLYTAKEFDLSAQILLPALDSVYMDRHVVEMVRQRVGEMSGYRMLVAFIGDRDFAETKRLADAIVQRYPGTRFHGYAVELAKEMPKRPDDFKKLTLPTAEQWAELKKKLKRPEQIGYLAERMRLLNCFQWGQPGGYSINDSQYAEPCGLSRDASWGGGLGKTKVINPYIELVGGAEGVFVDRESKFKGLDLTVNDIPALAPFLRDDWHILCVSFWRNFHPDRELHTTRPLFESIINDLAKRDICRTSEMAKMSPAEIDRHIEKIIAWSRENGAKSEQQLLWETLDEEVKAGKPWGRLTNSYRLIELKDKRMLPVLRKYVNETTSEYDLHSILYWCLDFDPSAFIEPARKFAAHKTIDLRLAAGHILFAGGKRDEGLRVFADILENGSPWQLEENALPRLIKTLLEEGSDKSKQTAPLIFKNKRYAEIHYGWVRASLVTQCAKAGIGEGYLSYLPLLDIKGPSIGNISYAQGTDAGDMIAKEIVDTLAPQDPEIVRIKNMFPRDADRIAPLKEWLRSKAREVSGAKSSP